MRTAGLWAALVAFAFLAPYALPHATHHRPDGPGRVQTR